MNTEKEHFSWKVWLFLVAFMSSPVWGSYIVVKATQGGSAGEIVAIMAAFIFILFGAGMIAGANGWLSSDGIVENAEEVK